MSTVSLGKGQENVHQWDEHSSHHKGLPGSSRVLQMMKKVNPAGLQVWGTYLRRSRSFCFPFLSKSASSKYTAMLLSLLTSPKLSKTAKNFNFLGTPALLYPLFSPISESLFRQLYLHPNLTPVPFLVNHNYTNSTTINKKVLLANSRLLQSILDPLILGQKRKSHMPPNFIFLPNNTQLVYIISP